MAAPAASTTRWERKGEPGSAFSGLSRGRGSRGRGGHRGGGWGSTSKDNLPPPTSHPTTQPSVADSPPIATTGHSKPPRKPSRGDPPPLQAPVPQARSSNRRRRSQVSKNSTIDPKLSTAASTDSQHLVVPASALTKDPPPHLKRQVDVRHDIDALVERVRAVAMDNRPTTPGSHIDWAGDDDDTLPDLNDWGVNTSNFAPGGSETISPIILEGLKPLPVISAHVTPSPLRRATTLDNPATIDIKVNVIKNGCEEFTSTPSKPDAELLAVSTMPVASKNQDVVSHVKVEQPSPSKHICAPYSSNQMSWHPSLPPKPPAGSLVPHVNLRPVATPMRHPVPPKSITAHKECSLPKKAQCALEQVVVESTSATSPMSVEVVSAIVKLADENVLETSNTEARAKSAASDTQPDLTDPPHQKGVFDDDNKAEGLEASIHAPKTPAPTESFIPPRNYRPYKKEAINRHPPLSRKPNGDHGSRYKQWNESGLPPRHQLSSNATAGPPNSYHRIHTSRPIITGDAMSRLARTIGQTNSAT